MHALDGVCSLVGVLEMDSQIKPAGLAGYRCGGGGGGGGGGDVFIIPLGVRVLSHKHTMPSVYLKAIMV